MIVGIPKEIKAHEYRVGQTPAGVRELIAKGAKVLVQQGAGAGSSFSDAMYAEVGAEILSTAKEVWERSDMIIKVKEPVGEELNLLQENQTLYTYLHLAIAPELAQTMLDKKVTSVAYETVQLPSGALPLLKPMSEVAGRMAVQVAAFYLQKDHGGRGVLLGGVPGVARGRVTVLGGGVVGINACKMAMGLGAKVTVLDVNPDRLEYLDDLFGGKIQTLYSNIDNVEKSVSEADLVVGAVLIPGAKAPRLVTRDLISRMQKGAVIVDVAVDQGGCVETCKPTTHENPTFEVDGVVHYCVANMPGAVSNTSTTALTNVTTPHALAMVKNGVDSALRANPALAKGLNTYGGYMAHAVVAEALGLEFKAFA